MGEALSGMVQESPLERVLDALNNPALVCDPEGWIAYANGALEDLLGRSAGDLVGKPLSSIVSPAAARSESEGPPGFPPSLSEAHPPGPVRGAALGRQGAAVGVEIVFSELGRPGRRPLTIAILRKLEREEDELRRAREAAVAARARDLVSSRERAGEAEAYLRLAVEAAQLGTWDFDPKANTIRCDDRYRELCGARPNAQVGLEAMQEAVHPDDREAAFAAGRRSLNPSSGGNYATEFRIIGIEDGIERWIACRGRAFFDESGSPTRFVGIGADVTEERRALERERFLKEASAILSSSLDYREMLPRLVALAVPRLADWCTIHLVSEAPETEPIAVAHADPAKIALARELGRWQGTDQASSLSVARVMAGREARLVAHVDVEALTGDPSHLRLVTDLRPRSAILVPLRARDGAIGVLSLFQSDSGRTFVEADRAFAGELADRVATSIENARLYDQAKKAIGVRDQFLSIASHELRTPLTALSLQLAGLSRIATAGALTTLPPGKLEARVSRMEKQLTRLASLVDELLDVSRISTGRLALDRAPTNLVDIVKEVAERLSDEAVRARAPLVVRAPETLTGTWDANRVDQVITNLVDNALKYAGGAPIEIAAERRGESAFVSVTDRGPGVAEQDQRRIFGQFERAAPATMAGLGLGLWISSRIAEAHGGSIRVESRPGEGASFVLELPSTGP